MALELALDAELDFEQIPCVHPGHRTGILWPTWGFKNPENPTGDFSLDSNIWTTDMLLPQSLRTEVMKLTNKTMMQYDAIKNKWTCWVVTLFGLKTLGPW